MLGSFAPKIQVAVDAIRAENPDLLDATRSEITPLETPRIHVGIDATIWSNEPRGHSLYAMRICEQLPYLLPNATFTAYCQHKIHLDGELANWNLGSWRNVYGNATWLPPVLWNKLVLGKLCQRDRVDIFWSPYSFLPILPRKIRTLLTILDFTSKISPTSFDPLHLAAHRLFAARDARRADSLLTISEGTKLQIQKHYGLTSLVIPPAVDEIFSRPSNSTLSETLAKYQINTPYLFNVAAWEPRKNVANLIRAFLTLKNQGKLPNHTLVLAGKHGRSSTEIQNLIQGHEKHIKVLGYVRREHLPSLYAGAEALVFPSLYEGFGMPVAEAIQCGTHVITTDSIELRQAGGKNCTYVQPTEEGIRHGIETLGSLPQQPTEPPPGISWACSAAILAKEISHLANAPLKSHSGH